MLPQADIVRWRAVAPWADDDDVEQDLAITLALFDIFRDPDLTAALAFRSGTVLHKLHLSPVPGAGRTSIQSRSGWPRRRTSSPRRARPRAV